jgi:hypothetical protein
MTQAVEVSAGTNGVSRFCYAFASVASCCGISLGMFMGIAHDFTLVPVHAHINLIGWVSMFMFGVYFRQHPQRAGRLAKIQVALVSLGLVASFGSLAITLTTGDEVLLPLTIAGSVMVLAGFVIFCGIVCHEALRT